MYPKKHVPKISLDNTLVESQGILHVNILT